MDKNYYDILGLKRNASQQQIADSYRRLALRWYPKTAKQDIKTSSYYFSQVSEAYEVLSDPVKRAFFDKHGWKKLTQQLYADANLKGGYKFGNNAQEIFDNFFASNTVLDQVLDKNIQTKGSLFSQAFGGLNYENKQEKQDLVVQVFCTLNQLYKGEAKSIVYKKKTLNMDGRSLSVKHHEKLLEIKPGYSKNTQLRFKQQGNQSIERKTSDLVFKIIQIPHALYSRSGNDLIYNAKISLAKALSCQPLQIITLDGRKLRVSLSQIPSPQSLHEIIGQGMPITDEKKKGNLYIRFDIQFPKSIPEQVKIQLRKLLE